MTQPAEIIEQEAPETAVPPAEEAEAPPAEPTPEEAAKLAAKKNVEELSALAKAEKARWRQKQQFKSDQQQLLQRDAARERELAAMRSELERARTNYIEYAEERGVTAEQIAERIVRRGTPEYEIEQLNGRIKHMEDTATKAAKVASEAHYESSMRREEEKFHAIVTADEDKHPTLAAYPRERVLRLAHELAYEVKQKAIRQGYPDYEIDPKELAEALEKQESKIYERRQEKAASKSSGAQASSEGASNDSGRQGTKAGTRTLTNGQAAQRSSLPVNFDELSDKEQNKILAQKLREGWRG